MESQKLSGDDKNIYTIIKNLSEQKKKIIDLETLKKHPIYGSFFINLNKEEDKKIKDLILLYKEEFKYEIIENYMDKKKYIPFTKDIKKEFNLFGIEKEDEIKKIIENYIVYSLTDNTKKTNSFKLFAIFFESNKDLFWAYRELNEKYKNKKSKNLSKKEIELKEEIGRILFNYEDRLTKKLVGKYAIGQEKTLNTWYDFVNQYFPLYNVL